MAIQQQQLQLDGRQSLPPSSRPPALLTQPLPSPQPLTPLLSGLTPLPPRQQAAVDTGGYTIYPINRLATVARDPPSSTFANTVASLCIPNTPIRPSIPYCSNWRGNAQRAAVPSGAGVYDDHGNHGQPRKLIGRFLANPEETKTRRKTTRQSSRGPIRER